MFWKAENSTSLQYDNLFTETVPYSFLYLNYIWNNLYYAY